MANVAAIEALLERVRVGDVTKLPELLALLADHTLLIPVSEVRRVEQEPDTSKVRVATFARESRRLVPCFTDHERFTRWSVGRYQDFTISGADLAISLPTETWLVLNPGQAGMVELSPAEVAELGQVAVQLSVVESPSTGVAVSEPPRQKAQTGQPRTAESDSIDAVIDGPSDEDPPFPDSLELLNEQICAICRTFPEVQEAYLQCDPVGGARECVVGLLTAGLDAERRFLLIDKIAELSRQLLGSAGALEVYDDLDVKTSRSWDLFNALSPIYERQFYGTFSHGPGFTTEEPAVMNEGRVRGLAEDIQSSSHPDRSWQEPDSALSWTAVRKTGTKLIGALKGPTQKN